MRTTLVSAIALGFAFAMPAYAQQAGSPGAAGAAGTQMQQPGQMQAGAQGAVDIERVKEKLGEAGIEERSEFGGKLLRARTAEGQTIFMLIGPRDMGEGSVDLNEDEIRQKFTEAGFTGVEVIEEASLVRGQLDDDKSIFVLSAGQFGDQAGVTGTISPSPAMDSPAASPGLGAPGAAGSPGGLGAPGAPGAAGGAQPMQPGAPGGTQAPQ